MSGHTRCDTYPKFRPIGVKPDNLGRVVIAHSKTGPCALLHYVWRCLMCCGGHAAPSSGGQRHTCITHASATGRGIRDVTHVKFLDRSELNPRIETVLWLRVPRLDRAPCRSTCGVVSCAAAARPVRSDAESATPTSHTLAQQVGAYEM